MDFFKKSSGIILLFFIICCCSVLNITDAKFHGVQTALASELQSDGVTDIADILKKEILNSHNEYRKNHGVPLLIHSDELSVIAQKYVNEWANTTKHPKKNSDLKKVGINVSKFSFVDDPEPSKVGKLLVEQWYKQIGCYDFESTELKPNISREVGTFVQLIWKDTTELGVGATESESGEWHVACLYKPKGNIEGKYQKNVLKPLDGDIKFGCGDTSASKNRVKIAEFYNMPLFLLINVMFYITSF